MKPFGHLVGAAELGVHAQVLTMRSLIFLLINMRKILAILMSQFNQKGEPTRIHDFFLKGTHP